MAGQGRLFPPTKVAAFEEDLERAIRSDDVHDEAGVVRICFRHGVKPQHAKPVLARLKAERVIECAFQVPQVDRLKNPRPLKMLSGEGKP